jgi:hypothetical protein
MEAMNAMTSKQALKEAQRRWGKGAGVKHNKAACQTREENEQARKAHIEFMENFNTTLKAASNDDRSRLRKTRNELEARARTEPFYVGCIDKYLKMFFEVKGSGYSWEEALFNADWSEAREHDEWYHQRADPCPTCHPEQHCKRVTAVTKRALRS